MSSWRPPGRNDGQRCERSPLAGSSVVSAVGVPPFALTRISAPLVEAENTIVPSSPQLAPRASAPAVIRFDAPPAIDTRRSSFPAKKPTSRPSGEKNGCCARTVSGSSVAPGWSSVRR